MIELKKTAGGIEAKGHEIPVMDFYDVVVIGGGVAGTAAGMAAAKRGMKTVILETFTGAGRPYDAGPREYPAGLRFRSRQGNVRRA